MRVTVIFDDGTVYVDEVARQVPLPAADPNWRALQWYGARGDVELREGPSFAFRDPFIVQPYVLAWINAERVE